MSNLELLEDTKPSRTFDWATATEDQIAAHLAWCQSPVQLCQDCSAMCEAGRLPVNAA